MQSTKARDASSRFRYSKWELGMIGNTDEKAAKFRERLVNLETERRTLGEDIKELATEMKSAGLSALEIAAVKLSVRRHFETEDKRKRRETIEEIAESLGALRVLPLGAAALERVG